MSLKENRKRDRDTEKLIAAAIAYVEGGKESVPSHADYIRLCETVQPFLKKVPRVVWGQRWVNDKSFVLSGTRSDDPRLRDKEVPFIELTPEVLDALEAAGIEVKGVEG